MRTPLDRDDVLRIHLKFRIGSVMRAPAGDSVEDHKVNGFFVQFTSTAEPLVSSFSDAEVVTFHGLVLMFISHHEQEDHSYHTTWRYFDRPTQVKRAYIQVLFDQVQQGLRREDGCTIAPGEHLMEWLLTFDFETSKTLKLVVVNDGGSAPTECFTVAAIDRYVAHDSNHMNVFTSMGSHFTFSVGLTEVTFAEKKHRLDVKESLQVSKELAAEIFDKVRTFSAAINADKATLKEVTEGYRELAAKSAQLEGYVADLFRGTRRFEEHVVESITRLTVMNPQTIPKMMRIRALLDTLRFRQDKVFQRLVSIKGLMAAKKVFKRARSLLKKVELGLKTLTDDVNSDDFRRFFAKANSFAGLLNRIDLPSFVADVG